MASRLEVVKIWVAARAKERKNNEWESLGTQRGMLDVRGFVQHRRTPRKDDFRDGQTIKYVRTHGGSLKHKDEVTSICRRDSLHIDRVDNHRHHQRGVI